jgi:hypothetical protein
VLGAALLRTARERRWVRAVPGLPRALTVTPAGARTLTGPAAAAG